METVALCHNDSPGSNGATAPLRIVAYVDDGSGVFAGRRAAAYRGRMTTSRSDTLRFPPFWAAAIDGAVVLLFVLIGRASHDEDPVIGALTTYWPFLVGLLLGWLITRGWRAPLSLVRTALPVWAVTVVVGLLLRAVTGQGVQPSFVIVTSVVLAVFLLGWRAVVGFVVRRQSRKALTRT